MEEDEDAGLFLESFQKITNLMAKKSTTNVRINTCRANLSFDQYFGWAL